MNNKFRELIKQAGTDTSGKWISVDNAENLIRLVAQECSAVANHFNDGHEKDQFGRKMFHYTVDVGQVILGHFGEDDGKSN